MIWHTKERQVDLGLIPDFLSEFDARPAAEQINANYQHGGGWRPISGWGYLPLSHSIVYGSNEDHEVYEPVAWTSLRQEYIFLYPSAWMCIVQPDGSFEVARVDR